MTYLSHDTLFYLESRSGIAKSFVLHQNKFSKPIGKIVFHTNHSKDNTLSNIALISAVIGLIALGFYLYHSGIKKTSSSAKTNPFNIDKHLGQIFNSSEIDEVLGISELENHDSRRVTRSRLIRKINQDSTNAYIERITDQNDRRYYLYKISPKKKKDKN